MIQNKTVTESTENFKLPGTICGDEKMHNQLSRYLEQDSVNQADDRQKYISDDPFKTRDPQYMAYKYHHKHSRNNQPYNTLTENYN